MRKAVVLILFALVPELSAKFKPWYWYFNSAYGTRALSMGKAFTAVADDGTALFWNPAGQARLPEMQIYFSYRTDLQSMSESEQMTIGEITRKHSYKFESRLNQIDFFSLTFPFGKEDWRYAAGFGYYRWLPTGFLGNSQGALFNDSPWELLEVHNIAFRGSDGYDVLAVTGAVDWKGIVAVGLTLQSFFNTPLLHYEYKATTDTKIEEISGKMGSRNLIFGFMFTPLPSLTIAASMQTKVDRAVRKEIFSRLISPDGRILEEEFEELVHRVSFPSRLALGVRLRPNPRLTIAYEFSRHDWEPASLEESDPFYSSYQLVRANETLQDPINHRAGIEYTFPYKRTDVAVRAGWFYERTLVTDALGKGIYFTGITLGMGFRLFKDFNLDVAYMKPWGEWPEWGFLRPGLTTRSLFLQDTFSLAITYRFRSLFTQ